jgi:putative transposase
VETGEDFAKRRRRCRPRPGDKWCLDEVFIRISGVRHYRWRAVGQDGVVLDVLVQARRDGNAAKRLFRWMRNSLLYVPQVIVTDKLRSHGVTHRQLLPKVEHRQSRYLDNRAENSRRPTRRRERQMQRFKKANYNTRSSLKLVTTSLPGSWMAPILVSHRANSGTRRRGEVHPNSSRHAT